jgi:DNA-binding response OmpR family regulator
MTINILIVDDMQKMRATALGIEDSLGYNVNLAGHTSDAEGMIGKKEYRAALVDPFYLWDIWEKDKTSDFFRNLREKRILVVASTVCKKRFLSDKYGLKENDYDSYILKPYKVGSLSKALKNLIEEKKSFSIEY